MLIFIFTKSRVFYSFEFLSVCIILVLSAICENFGTCNMLFQDFMVHHFNSWITSIHIFIFVFFKRLNMYFTILKCKLVPHLVINDHIQEWYYMKSFVMYVFFSMTQYAYCTSYLRYLTHNYIDQSFITLSTLNL